MRKGIATDRMVFLKDHLKCDDDPSIVVEVKKYISEALSGRTS